MSRWPDVEVRIVPGLSAMQAAAARVGAPLGHDFCVVSLSDQLKPWEVVERRLDAAGAADLVLALYNPASRTRREQLARAVEVLRAPSRRRDAGRRRARGRRAGGVGLGHDARRARPRRRRHAHAADRRVLDDAHDRGRAAARLHPASLPRVSAAPSPGPPRRRPRSGRRAAAGGARRSPRSPRSRAASSLASRVRPAAVLGDDQVDRVVIDERQLPVERVRAAIEQDLAAGRKRRAGRVDAADQEPGVVDAREGGEALAAGRRAGRARPCPRWPRRPRRGRRPSASGRRGARSSRGARGAGSARRRPARPAPPRRRCARANGCVASTTAATRCSASQRASASGPPKPPMRTSPSGRRGLATRPASDEVTATPARCRRRGELARLGRAAEDQDHAIARRV